MELIYKRSCSRRCSRAKGGRNIGRFVCVPLKLPRSVIPWVGSHEPLLGHSARTFSQDPQPRAHPGSTIRLRGPPWSQHRAVPSLQCLPYWANLDTEISLLPTNLLAHTSILRLQLVITFVKGLSPQFTK